VIDYNCSILLRRAEIDSRRPPNSTGIKALPKELDVPSSFRPIEPEAGTRRENLESQSRESGAIEQDRLVDIIYKRMQRMQKMPQAVSE
jgi:hypothetical protein